MPARSSPPRSLLIGRTAWHPMFAALMRLVLPPQGWEVLPEVPLAKEPLRIDMLVVRRLTRAPLPDLLRPEVERFGKLTLVHFISPSDEPEADDALAIVAYGCQFVRLQGPKGAEVQKQVVLFVVCSAITPRYLAAVERLDGTLARLEDGIWQGTLAGFSLWVVETGKRHRHPREGLLYALSRGFIDDPGAMSAPSEEEREVLRQLRRHMQRFEAEGDELMAGEVQKISRGLREATRRLIADAPLEDRLAGLTPEQRLSGLTPGQREELLSLLQAPKATSQKSSVRRKR